MVGVGTLGWTAGAASAAIAVSPPTLDFLQVNVGTPSAPQTVTITNDDNMATASVTMQPSGGCAGTLSFSPSATVVVPMRVGSTDGSITVDVIFTPASRAALSGCVITANGPGGGDPTIPVDGDGLASTLSITQPTINFNPQRHNGGTPEVRNLTVQNDGELDVTVAQFTTSLTNSTDFSLGALSGTIAGNGGTATLPITFNPASNGAKTSTLSIGATNDSPDVPTNITLNGTGTQSVLTVAATLTIGPTPAGTAATNTLSVQNTGVEPLNIATMAITGAGASVFSFTDHGCTGQTCTTPGAIAMSVTEPFVVRCNSATGGTFGATLTITSDDGVSATDVVTLSCTTVPPTLSVTTPTNFGTIRVGTPAAVKTITISNAAGAQALTYTAVTSSAGEFPLTCVTHPTCTGTVAAGANATIQVGFVPTAVGARSGSITLTTNDPDPTDATKVIPVAGTGAISTVSAANTLSFSTVDIAAAGGVTQPLVITNSGGVSLNLVGSMTITGDPSGNFTFAFGSCTTGQTCSSLPSVAAGGNTTITLRCDPATIGLKTGTLNIPTDDPASPKTVSLTCTGATPDLQIAGTPLADFGNQRINNTSPTTRTFTISNPAGTTTSAMTYTVSPPAQHFSIACSAPGCTGTLNPGATAVTVTVSFRPTVTGPVTGNVNVASSDVSTPSVNIAVSGTGVEPLVALTAPVPSAPPTVGGAVTFTDTNVGATSATQTITVQNTGSMTLTITSVTNSNTADFDLVGPATTTIAPAGTASWTVACSPDTQGTRTGTISVVNDSNNDTAVDVGLSCSAIRGRIVVTSATPFAYTQPTNTIDFGTTFLNQSKMTTVTISNIGNRPVTISTITSAPAAQGYTLGAASAMVVPAGGTITLPITFMPTLNTQGTATVTLATDWNTLAFTVTGDGVDSGLVIMPGAGAGCVNTLSAYDYGQVAWDASRPQGFCFKNIGQAAAPLTSVTLIGAAGNYTIAGVPGTLPTLITGQQLDVTVTADPNDAMLGVFTATLDVTSTLPGADAHRTVALTMTSVGPTMALNPGAALDFGGVDVDLVGGRVLPLTVTNMLPAGAAPLVISGVTNPTGSFSLVGAMPGTIASGESVTMMVRFDPSVERSAATMESSSFTINTTGYYVGGVRQPLGQAITLTGYGVDQHVSVSAPTIAFGDVYRNPRADDPRAVKTVAVCNTGEAALAVSMITDPAAPFDVTSASTLSLTGVAAPGGAPVCQDVTVEFRPADEAYQSYTGAITVMNDDEGNAMAEVTLSGTSIVRPVTVTSGVTATDVLAVGVPVRLTEVFPTGLTAKNEAIPAEPFTIELRPTSAQARVEVVGDAERELAMGETEVYDLTITAQTAGDVTFTADVYLDGDTFPHAQIPVTLTAVDVQVRGGGGCSTSGKGGRGTVALLVLALAVAMRRRRAARGVLALAVIAAVAATAAPAAAQGSRDLELSTFSPAPATEGQMFAIESPTVGAKGAWALDLAFNHAVSPMTIADTGMAGGDIVSGRTAVELGFAYAIAAKLELGVRVPLLSQQGANPGIAGLDFSNGGGSTIGDIGVLARYALVDGAKTKVGASATITAPTAKADQFAGSGTVTGAARLLLSQAAGKRITLAANAGFLVRGGATEFAGMTQGHQVLFGAGVSVRTLEKLWLIGETFGRMGLGSDDAAAASPIEATVGLRYRMGQSVALSLGGGTGLRAGIGAPKVRGFLMLSFSPKARKDAPLHIYVPPPPRDVGDDDGDGVVNADDACKLDAEDMDGFEDEDGCPDADNDKDSLLDADDKCPNQPEDKDGFEDDDGCIDPDNDGDGVPDTEDKCPSEPEDKDGFQDDDGCEEPDNDGDGVPDVLDQCAMEPETINGNADEDGCPDKGDSLIMVMPDRIEVLDPVTFVGTTTKLSKNAPKALSQIGATMRADRKIKRLRITVHVHPRGPGDEALSQKRADEIRTWLVNWGVEPERLDSRGIGSKRPLVPKKAKGAEQINDRVEFIIFERQ
ncbi:MAG: choice-of-anchor D domain-containing protein [Myxococcales bacterium]|nr:choice-of-anchor D domain-containing protein [Myxococcales bacterium]